jgi:hypothetical protein
LVSIIITVAFIIISNTLLNENSRFYILPDAPFEPLQITKEEYDAAKVIVQKYEKSHPPISSLPT